MNQQTKPHPGIYVLMLLVPLFWGAAFGAGKHVVTEIPPLTAAAFRFGFAGILLAVWVTITKEWNLTAIRSRWMGLLIMSLTGIFTYNMLFFVAIQYTSAANGSLIMATSPVFITLGAILFLKEAGSKRLMMGILLSLLGVIAVITKGSPDVLLSLSFEKGDVMFIAAMFTWVTNGVLGKVVMKEVSPLLTTTVTTLFGSALLVLFSFTEEGWGKIPEMSGQAWMEMLFLILFATVIAFFLWNKGIQRIGASKTGAYMNLVPVNAAWISAIFYGAQITWLQIIGMLMVITGVSIAMSRKNVWRKIRNENTALHTH